MMMLLGVFLGGGLGAVLRWVFGHVMKPVDLGARFDAFMQTPGTPRAHFPLGTFAANMLACLLLGVVSTVIDHSQVEFVTLSIGFCGALGTYSTFSVELISLCMNRQWHMAVTYAAVSTIGGLLLLSTSLVVGTVVM
ncbi:CrcB family protein [Stomatohabitans albus]|uniref:FluC/FEX family fluoride channel n=1 Tax=Stomatohabitans albus TaxID=3110766 RepID=UPI00300C7092